MSANLKEELDNLQKQFYEENGKNTFFKSKQKTECAKMICSKYSFTDLMANTIYQIGLSNRVFIDYTIFKLFANADNYKEIIYYVFSLFRKVLESYDNYEVHINLDSFTVTAAERYKDIIKLYCDESAKNGTHFIDTLTFMKLYNLPSVLEMITKIIKPVINADAYSKMVLLSKEESRAGISELMN